MTARNSLYITPFSREGEMARSKSTSTTPTSSTSTGSRAYYHVVNIENPGIVYRFFWLNGATVGTDNVQMGLYLADGTDGGPGTALKLGTSTLSAGANACQYDDIADTAVAAGLYWIAQWISGSTATLFRSSTAVRMYGSYMQSAIAGGLPASATPIQQAGNFVPVAGLVMRSAP